MLDYLTVIAGSWPIAAMVVSTGVCFVVRKSLRQKMNNDQEITTLRASQAVVVRQRDDY